MENTDICLKTQKAILSDNEPNAEQERHIKQCKTCRELLSQTASLKNDLKGFEFCKVDELGISDAVIEKIKAEQKSSAKIPKFKLTHHLGSAAAIVIILATALILKNPTTPKSDTNVAFSENADTDTALPESHILPSNGNSDDNVIGDSGDVASQLSQTSENDSDEALYARFAVYSDHSDDFSAGNNDTVTENIENGGGVSEMNGFGFPPAYDGEDESQILTVTDAESSNESADTAFSGGNDKEDISIKAARGQSKDELETENLNEPEISTEYYSDNESESLSQDFKDCEEDATEDERVSLFEGIEFLSGEENFDYNLSLARNRLEEIYGTELDCNREMLERFGYDTNENLLELIAKIEYEDAEKLKQKFALFLLANS